MEIKIFTLHQLKKELENPKFWKTKYFPISKQRLIAHLNNPRAEENDVLLVVGYDNEEVVGYIGNIPDSIFIDNIKHKFCWLTAWWLHPSMQGKGFGYSILKAAIENIPAPKGAVGMSPFSKKVLLQSGEFQFMERCSGTDYILRYTIEKPQTIKQRFKNGILMIMNKLNKLKQKKWLQKNINHSLSFEYITQLDAETVNFVNQYDKDNTFRRREEELNWIIQHKWLIDSPLKDKNHDKYFFSSYAKNFSYITFKIFLKEEFIGFCILRNRDNYITIPYLAYIDKYIDNVLISIGLHLQKMEIASITIFNKEVVAAFNRLEYPSIKTRTTIKEAIMSKKIGEIDFSEFYLQDGFGDYAST